MVSRMSERKRSGYARQYNIRSEMTGPDMTHQQYPVPLHTALSEHAHGKDTQTIIIYTAAMDLPAFIVNKTSPHYRRACPESLHEMYCIKLTWKKYITYWNPLYVYLHTPETL